MKLADTITLHCTFGGGGGDAASSTAPIGQHPETDGTTGREKMRKGGPDKGGVQGTSGGQSEGSSLTARKFYVVDGQGRVLHTFQTREEAESASAGNRYSKVVTHVEQEAPPEAAEVMDYIRRRPADTQMRTYQGSVPYPNTVYPGRPQSR